MNESMYQMYHRQAFGARSERTEVVATTEEVVDARYDNLLDAWAACTVILLLAWAVILLLAWAAVMLIKGRVHRKASDAKERADYTLSPSDVMSRLDVVEAKIEAIATTVRSNLSIQIEELRLHVHIIESAIISLDQHILEGVSHKVIEMKRSLADLAQNAKRASLELDGIGDLDRKWNLPPPTTPPPPAL